MAPQPSMFQVAKKPKVSIGSRLGVPATNPVTHQQYILQPAAGGAYHVYPDGRRIFVPSKAPKPAPVAPSVAPASPSAASAAAAHAPVQIGSEFLTAKAQALSNLNTTEATSAQAETQDRSNYEEALRRLTLEQPRSQEKALNENAKAGLFYSGNANRDVQSIADQYARQRADALQGYTTRQGERAGALRSARGGYEALDPALYEQAAEQSVTSDAARADQDALAPNTPLPKPAAPKPAAAKPKFKTVTIRGYVFHVYPDGHRVAMGKAK